MSDDSEFRKGQKLKLWNVKGKGKVLHEIGGGEDGDPVIGGGVLRAEFHCDPRSVFEFVLSEAARNSEENLLIF
jgi:hypothetical protein